MKKKDNFDNDIILGEEAEYKLLAIIQKKYPKAYKIEGEFKAYDIYIPEIDKRIEVKRDIGSKDTPNYFIEYECNYKSSGLHTTEADYWAIYDEHKFHFINVSKLRTIAVHYGSKWEGTPVGGASNVKAYLVDKSIIKLCEEKDDPVYK